KIRDLDISRQTFIVMVKRGNNVIIPKGDLILREGDKVILFSQTSIANTDTISI
ncbi:MAG: potassium channel protein, partial [Oscillospiraceae bacterium]|nr:potassium channel protein [Oscillospiraceae bacterium]